jgi:hypothetical protein
MINNKNKFSWFTLVEVLVSIVLFSIIILAWFQALSAVWVWKIKLIEKTNIEKEAFFASEKFFELIKKWWTVDYEEYFNRKIISGIDTDKLLDMDNGHYQTKSWFWNFWKSWVIWNPNYWDWFYYCRSSQTKTYWDDNADWILFDWNNDSNYKSWCLRDNNYDWDVAHIWDFTNDYSLSPQRYWQYSFVFLDYNWDKNADLGDINEDWNPILDDDDEPLWTGPTVFDIWDELTELYLLNKINKQRTLFRWTFSQDPDDNANVCNTKTWWDWCLWNIEFLKLEWKDFWLKHNPADTVDNFWLNDWVIDTWVIAEEFEWNASYIVAWSDENNYWQKIFPNTINVKNLKFILYPNKDSDLAWKDSFDSVSNISPFVKIYMTLTPSAKKRRWIAGKAPEIKIATTINLGSN